jgi:hypothetical protein
LYKINECFKLAFSGNGVKIMGNVTKDEALYQEMCRVVGKVVLEMRDLGQEPKHIVIAGVLRTSLANQRVKRSELTTQAMETVVKALAG